MTPSPTEVRISLYGAARFLRFDAKAIGFFNDSDEGFWNSFFAAILILPAHYYIRWIDSSALPESVNPLGVAILDLLTYVISWVAYPLVMYHLIKLHDQERYFRRFVIIYNWLQVWGALFFVFIETITPTRQVAEAQGISGPAGPVAFIATIIVLYMLAVQANMTKVTLQVTWFPAAIFVLVDILLGYMIHSISLAVQMS